MREMLDDRQLADLHVLLDVSRELGASTELVPMLTKVEQAVLQVLDCERGTVFLYDKDENELYSLVATGEETIRFGADLGMPSSTCATLTPTSDSTPPSISKRGSERATS